MKNLIKLLFLTSILFACQEEPVSKIQNEIPEIGSYYQCGIVFYLFQDGDLDYVENEIHGLIILENDIEDSNWGCSFTNPTDFREEIGKGLNNSIAISSSCSSGAANDCLNFFNEYEDWFLPNHEELKQAYNNSLFVNSNNADYYWTSDRHTANEGVSFRVGDAKWEAKSNNTILKVRPIRKF
jgi:hypothetical protein